MNGLMKHVFDPLAEAVTPVSGFGEFLRQSIEAAKGLPSSQADQVIADMYAYTNSLPKVAEPGKREYSAPAGAPQE